MAQQQRPATIADVAHKAGVSQGTVSKALNGTGQLSDGTRARVDSAARELGYKARTPARSVLGARTYTVGIISTDPYGRFTMPLLSGAENALATDQISILLCETRGDAIREAHYVRTLIERRVDGIIVTGPSSDARPSLTRGLPVPVVYALGPSSDSRDHSVLSDDRAGAVRVIQHLVGRGKRSIAVIAGPRRHLANQHRVDSAAQAIELDTSARLVASMYGDWTESWGRDAAATLLAQNPEVDGIFCTNDQIARGVVEHLREVSIAVPAQIAVVGFDNWDVMVEASRPPLTSVDLNLAEVGRVAAMRLLEAVSGSRLEPGVEYVDCQLIERQSS
jgi:LacI family transcriptional regulator